MTHSSGTLSFFFLNMLIIIIIHSNGYYYYHNNSLTHFSINPVAQMNKLMLITPNIATRTASVGMVMVVYVD